MTPRSDAATSRERSTHRTLAAAVLTIVVGTMPVWLVGGLAFQITVELGFSAEGLGLAVAVFFGASALCSVPAGQLVQRWGPRFGMVSTGVLGACSLAGLAVADGLTSLLLCVGVAGVANSTCQPSANQSLTTGAALRRQGLAFGIKQAAIPVSTLVAGLAVPLIALTVGWRWAFLVALAGPLLLVLVAVRGRTGVRADGQEGGHAGDQLDGDVQAARPGRSSIVRPVPMIVLAAAGVLGAAAANSFGAFVVDSTISSGVTAGVAGVALAVGSLAGIGARIFWGWSADRRTGGHLRMVAVLMAGGAVLVGGLAVADDPVLLVVLVVAICCTGWSWPGLFSFAIVVRNPGAAASASGFLMTGIYAGGVVGPLAFGVTVDRAGYGPAWIAAGLTLLCAATLVLVGRHVLRQDVRRPASSLAHT